MKPIVRITLLLFLAQSCNKKSDNISLEQPEDPGKALVEASDCRTCHHATAKIVGPSHIEVAKRYETTDANVKMLAERIIKGGSGAWGTIPMTPHPTISQQDAEKMVRYILELDQSTAN